MTVIHSGRHVVIPPIMGVRTFAPKTAAATWEPDDWWTIAGVTCIVAYQAIGAPSQALSYTNVANPGTYDAFAGSAPSWDAGVGWTFDDTYLRTGLTPSSTSSMIINYTLTEAAGYAFAAGVFVSSPNNNFFILPGNPVGDFSLGWGDKWHNGYISPPEQNVRRTDAITPVSYYGAANKLGNWSSPTWNESIELYIGGRNYDDSANPGTCGIAVHALAIYDGTLADSDVTALAEAMADL